MLEGAVARILNQILEKYVTDIDFGNLNVGIFSGQVQLTDLKIKPEALYELQLPIEVTAGTIGKIWLKIPWSALWQEQIIISIEDVLIVSEPVVNRHEFDAEINKTLLRAMKKKLLDDVHLLGGPSYFAQHLITNLLNRLQLTVSNVHLRYEDEENNVAAGLCIGSITAESTNSKWKPSKADPKSENSHYLVKLDALSTYWNHDAKLGKWNLPSDYYAWKNAMSLSLQSYKMNDEEFDFVIKPMTMKIKMLTKKNQQGNITHLNMDYIVQDLNAYISKDQYKSFLLVSNSLDRMNTSWQFLSLRPKEKILENKRKWWKYAYLALLEQRVKPYSWSRIKKVRKNFKQYVETYKNIVLKPNNTEVKLELQQQEDNLSVFNIEIARQHARNSLANEGNSEKSFWSILPTSDRLILCQNIGFELNKSINLENIVHLRIGNFNTTLTNNNKELFLLTLTQFSFTIKPNNVTNTFKASIKIEGLIMEGANAEELLSPIVSSEHLSDSPAYFFKAELEKMPENSLSPYKLGVVMDSVEILYNKQSLTEITKFFDLQIDTPTFLYNFVETRPSKIENFCRNKLEERWDLSLNIKVPYVVIPESGCFLKTDHMLVLDLGRYTITSEICKNSDISGSPTIMEMEENLYSKLNIGCSGMQLLFCDTCDNWKDARKEKFTDMHIVPKTGFSSTYAISVANTELIPQCKFNIQFDTLKLNLSERKVFVLLKYFNTNIDYKLLEKKDNVEDIFCNDEIKTATGTSPLKKIQERLAIWSGFGKSEILKKEYSKDAEKPKENGFPDVPIENMNEAWAKNVDLPGLEDNISQSNRIKTLLGLTIKEFLLDFSRSSDKSDKKYLVLRLGVVSMDLALMTYGLAYQLVLRNFILSDKMHTNTSGQYLDLVHSSIEENLDVLTILYRKVDASCPEYWTSFHGVETSLVADLKSINLLLHQEAIHTVILYSKYFVNKVQTSLPPFLKYATNKCSKYVQSLIHKKMETPVPPGSIKFSHSARLSELNILVCDTDFDIINTKLSEYEIDFFFRANERFVFRSYLGNINVDNMEQETLYPKVLTTDEDKVFEVKYVKNSSQLSDITRTNENLVDGNFKFQLGTIHLTFLYKLLIKLQRFIINTEVLPYAKKLYSYIEQAITKAKETLTSSTKMNLSISVCGPVLIIPQKSSSPNVLIINTGVFHAENFFIENTNSIVENIMLMFKEISLSRGVNTLTNIIQMQETLIEPLGFNADIKRHMDVKSLKKHWEISSILENINITLGQKDISTIRSIFTDNIGEGQLHETLTPTEMTVESPTKENPDLTVENLEAFLCDPPKEPNIILKFVMENIDVALFFDSLELLSSPIRDLNHGFCKLNINHVDISTIFYTDKSCVGQMSINQLFIEEIGRNTNIYDKMILQSTMARSILIVEDPQPPIVNMTYRQSEKKNKNFEITFSELTLSLSVPFCDKVASFVLDCLPRDLIDFGIVNHGYEADFSYVSSKELMGSTSVLLRVKKPELIFYVESTSNKRRYFKTKTNVLMDYENRGGRENFSVNLGGTHSVFYNTGVYSFDPYLIVKHFDLEYINEYNEQSGQKISMNVSPVHVHLCSNVVHSLSDIFNDIIEHFKARDKEPPEIISTVEGECLWEPKKITQLLNKIEDFWEQKPENRLALPEFFFLTSTEAVVVFELDQIPVLLFKSTFEMHCNDWTSKLNFNCLFSLQANYFNEALQAWEPFVDPVVLDETEYKPWEASIKIMQDKAHAMLYTEENYVKPNDTDHRTSRCTTEDEDSADECMMYLEPVNSQGESKSRIKTNLSTFLEDSDSENEDQSMEKLASAISDLFTGDWNENEDSDCVQSSEGEEEEDESLKEVKFNSAFKYDKNQSKSTYITIDAKNKLTFTITPDVIKVFHEIFTAYSTKILSVLENRSFIRLTNEIAPQAKIDLFKKKFDEVFLVCSKTYEKEESASNSPVREAFAELDNPIATENCDEREDLDFNFNEEYLSSLNFPTESSGDLFTKINKYFLRIYVPNFPPMETPCYRRNWEKLIKLNGVGENQPYYLAAQHTISKSGRHVIISSPLKLKNETPHSLNILYQPSVLQQLNLEPVGNIINPFDTLMRITILEAYEEFNVPLYIAYHCKLFIQPAHSQGHYASETGIWWEDLATQIDTPINLQCNPKTNSESDLFCLKVVMRRNLDLKVSKAYSVPNYTIQLMPPVIINNMLPYRLEIKNKTVISMEPSEKVRVYSMDVSKDQKLPAQFDYNGVTCRAILNLNTQLDDKILVFTDESLKPNLVLPINIKIDREGSCNIFFYTPYWIVNKTQLPVQLKASGTDAIINCDKESILLFTYKRHGKPSINMRVHNSNWSNDFGMECAGTTGLVVCKDHTRRKKYMVFTKCSISNICPQLTKIVTLMPSFIVANHTEKHLRFMEHNEKTDLWNDLEPSQKMIFWPETNSMQMYVKFRDHKVISPPFFITTHHKTVLKMDKNGALTVEVIGGVNEPFTISFQSYKLGDAPILVRNCCENKHLKISQQGHTEATLLNPNYSFMYTWDDPTTSRKLVWNVYGSKGPGFYVDITKDGFGEQKIRCQKDEHSDSDSSDSTHSPKNGKTKKDRRTIYWICYRDGLQRVLLFTQDCGMYRSTLKHVLQEKSHLDLLVSLSGVDLSIFTNQNRQKEHVLLSLSESPAIWEVNVGKKWKTLTLELASWIEDNYRMHHKNCQLKDYVYVDFDKMYMIKPFIAEIRRSYSPAVYIHFRKSDKYHYYNFKIQDLQIDDQHKNIIVVRPTLSKNIQDSDSFIDIAISKYTTNICQSYRYITIEIGDFALNVEKDLVTQLSQLLSVFKQFQSNALKGYFKDMSYIYSTFLDKKMMQEGIKTVIENVSIKDFIIQLNTGNETTSVLDGRISAANFLNYLFPINVFPYMPIQGVNHKIPSIEHIELNQNLSQCLYYLFKQVATQFLQQYYSHVLGLQVLINYFAFYPSIEYNRLQTECISNVLYGTRCLLGHINMSPAALEQCILEIFENINMEEALSTRNQGVYFTSGMFPKHLAASSKNVETGVPIALSQLFTPNQKTNIVNPEKFFKATGKALFALLTKYPDGMSDSVEVAVEAVKRASILGEPIQIKRRLTRYGSNILGLKPISIYGSLGKQLLDIIANGKFQSDTYCIHAALDKIGKFIIIVTLEHIIKVNKVKIWGPWDVEWVVDMDDVIKVNKNDQSELVIQLRSGKMGDSDHLRISSFKEIVSWLNDKIEQAMMINLESNAWAIPEI